MYKNREELKQDIQDLRGSLETAEQQIYALLKKEQELGELKAKIANRNIDIIIRKSELYDMIKGKEATEVTAEAIGKKIEFEETALMVGYHK